MNTHSTYVGMDVHKESIQVAVILPRHSQVSEEWSMRHDAKAAGRLCRKLEKLSGRSRIVSCYEAGPCGYGFQRELEAAGIRCMVVAPSLIPIKPGDHIKTDRRDARKLAGLLRAEELTEVHPPTREQEALRDLCRAREDAKGDLLRARHRLSKMLLRHSVRYELGKQHWTQAHHRWLETLRFDDDLQQVVLDDYLRAIKEIGERITRLTGKIEQAATSEPYAPAVARLRCFRGIDTVAALTLVAELHEFSRFQSPRELMAYLGIVPSEHSSGARKHRGSITKTGNSHARRMLVEIAWHYRHQPAEGAKLRARRQGQPSWVIAVADRAQRRLHGKYWRMLARNKAPNIATVAVARELVGFLWSVLHPAAVIENVNA